MSKTKPDWEAISFSSIEDYINDVLLEREHLGLKGAKFSKRPGLAKLTQAAREVGCKMSLVMYCDAEDPEFEMGSVHPQVFRGCWEALGSPGNIFQLERAIRLLGLSPAEAHTRIRKACSLKEGQDG